MSKVSAYISPGKSLTRSGLITAIRQEINFHASLQIQYDSGNLPNAAVLSTSADAEISIEETRLGDGVLTSAFPKFDSISTTREISAENIVNTIVSNGYHCTQVRRGIFTVVHNPNDPDATTEETNIFHLDLAAQIWYNEFDRIAERFNIETNDLVIAEGERNVDATPEQRPTLEEGTGIPVEYAGLSANPHIIIVAEWYYFGDGEPNPSESYDALYTLGPGQLLLGEVGSYEAKYGSDGKPVYLAWDDTFEVYRIDPTTGNAHSDGTTYGYISTFTLANVISDTGIPKTTDEGVPVDFDKGSVRAVTIKRWYEELEPGNSTAEYYYNTHSKAALLLADSSYNVQKEPAKASLTAEGVPVGFSDIGDNPRFVTLQTWYTDWEPNNQTAIDAFSKYDSSRLILADSSTNEVLYDNAEPIWVVIDTDFKVVRQTPSGSVYYDANNDRVVYATLTSFSEYKPIFVGINDHLELVKVDGVGRPIYDSNNEFTVYDTVQTLEPYPLGPGIINMIKEVKSIVEEHIFNAPPEPISVCHSNCHSNCHNSRNRR